MKIKTWLRNGDPAFDDDVGTTEQLLQDAGRRLDKAYAQQIVGECLFIGEDDKVYVGTVEFCILEANPAYVKQVLEEESEV